AGASSPGLTGGSRHPTSDQPARFSSGSVVLDPPVKPGDDAGTGYGILDPAVKPGDDAGTGRGVLDPAVKPRDDVGIEYGQTQESRVDVHANERVAVHHRHHRDRADRGGRFSP